MRKKVKSVVNYFIIIILLIVGVLGIILPILPGLVFIVIAVLILSYEIPYIEELLEKKIDKNSKFGKTFFEYKIKLEKYFK